MLQATSTPHFYRVQSSNAYDWYAVLLEGNQAQCTCLAGFHSIPCKHVKEAREFEAKKTATKRTCHFCGQSHIEKPGYEALASYQDQDYNGYIAHPACQKRHGKQVR